MRIAVALALVAACTQAPEEPRRSIPAGPEPIVPSASPSASDELAWMKDLPKLPLRAKQGERVWGAVPLPSGLAEVAVFTVDAVSEGHAGLVDRSGKRYRRVPTALIQPIGDGRRLRDGDVALVHLWSLPATLARVSRLERGRVSHVHYDWLGRTKEGPVDHAEPPVTGIAPLAYVGYRKLGKISRALVVATHEGRAWLHTSSGHVEAKPIAELVALDVESGAYAAAQPVSAYRWATGYLAGTVAEVLEPGLRYRVAFPDEPAVPNEDYFFTDLSARRYK